jgi:hypothetical protein
MVCSRRIGRRAMGGRRGSTTGPRALGIVRSWPECLSGERRVMRSIRCWLQTMRRCSDDSVRDGVPAGVEAARRPDAIADEMAEDLAADLEEAQAEGVALEDVLGGGASDPRSFAASWATARGVTRVTSGSSRARRKPPIAAALTALLIAAVVAGAAAVVFGAGEPSLVPALHTPKGLKGRADEERSVAAPKVIATGSTSVPGLHEERSPAPPEAITTGSPSVSALQTLKGLKGRAYEERSLALPDVITTG